MSQVIRGDFIIGIDIPNTECNPPNEPLMQTEPLLTCRDYLLRHVHRSRETTI